MAGWQSPRAGSCPWTWAIALDGGTTTTRARLLCAGEIVATSRRTVGVRDTLSDSSGGPPPATASSTSSISPGQPHRQRLVQAVREVIDDVSRASLAATPGTPGESRPVQGFEAVVAAGMLSSEVGLIAVPHVTAPAGLDDLARSVVVAQLPEIADTPIYVVPGIRTPASDGPGGWL